MQTIDLQAEAQQEYKVVFSLMAPKEVLNCHNIIFVLGIPQGYY